MKRVLLAGVLSATMSAGAMAADFGAPPQVGYAPAPVANWSGFSVGVIGTGGMFTNSADDQWCYTACDAPELSSFGGGIGIQGGWQHQFGNMVAGVEGDFSWLSMSNSESYDDPDGGGWSHEGSWDAYATIRGKLGYSLGDALIYGTAGVAFADWDSLNECTFPYCFSAARAEMSGWETGFTVGGGTEYALSDRMSFKAEYLFIGMPSQRLGLDFDEEGGGGCEFGECDITVNSHAHVARLGVNFRF